MTAQVEQEIIKFMSADAAWAIFPRFREVYIWQILRLQARIDRYWQLHQSRARKGEAAGDTQEDKECEELLLRYGSLIKSLHQIDTLQAPDTVCIKDMKQLAIDNGMRDHEMLRHIVNAKSRHELVAPISPAFKRDWIFKIVEKLTWRMISKPSATYSTSTGDVPVYSDETVLQIARFTILIIASVCLLIPIVILHFVTKGFYPIMVIILWTITFTAVTALATDARHTEVMMASAAYAAVMVVFVRN